MECIKDVEFENAQDFLDYLSPSNPEWGKGLELNWIFRGVRGDWPLVPTVWRPQGEALLRPIVEQLNLCREELWSQIASKDRQDILLRATEERFCKEQTLDYLVSWAAEKEAVHQFAQLADELGQPVLGEGEKLLSGAEIMQWKFRHADYPIPTPGGEWDKTCVVEHRRVTSAYGFAQHHGVPTRLLDWTRNPFIAAYFAACEDNRFETERLVVWALDRSALGQHVDLKDAYISLLELTCPRYRHSFLHAQAGLFVSVFHADWYYFAKLKWPTIEDVLEEVYSMQKGSGCQPLRRIALPASLADEVLALLWRHRISRAHLMPTYDNITMSLISKWRLTGLG